MPITYYGGTTAGGGTGSAGYTPPTQTGNSGKFLTTDGSVTSWGVPGAYTLLSTTDMTSKNGVTITGIPQTYKHLFISIKNMGMGSANSMQWQLNSDSSNIHYWSYISNNSGTMANSNWGAPTTNMGTQNGWNGSTSKFELMIKDYTSNETKMVDGQWQEGGYYYTGRGFGAYRNTTGVTSFYIYGGYTFTSGSIRIYGVN